MMGSAKMASANAIFEIEAKKIAKAISPRIDAAWSEIIKRHPDMKKDRELKAALRSILLGEA